MSSSKLSRANRYFSEIYSCPACEIKFCEVEVKTDWKCPECQSYVLISANNEAETLRFQVTRKVASEVILNEFVHLPGALEGDPHEVLQIKRKGKEVVFSLRGFGPLKVAIDSAVVCREGSW